MAKPKHITAFRGGKRYQRGVPRPLRPIVGRSIWLHDLGDVTNETAAKEAQRIDAYYDGVIARLNELPKEQQAALVAAGGIATYARMVAARAWLTDAAIRTLESDDKPKSTDGLPPNLINIPRKAQRRLDGEAALTALKLRKERDTQAPQMAELQEVLDSLGPPQSGTRLATLLDKWEQVAAPRSPRTRPRMELYLGRFTEAVAEMPPKAVTRQHAMEYRDWLATQPGIAKSTHKHLNALSRLFTVGVSEGLVDFNPFHGIKALKPQARKLSDDKAVKPFTPNQARAILAALDKLDLDEERWRDFRHVFRLMIYHGCRSGELCNMTPGSVSKTQGIWVLHLHDEVAGTTIKNAASIRDVPLHPACNDLVRYAGSAKKAGKVWLFDSLPNWDTGRAGKFQQMATVFLRDTVGIADKKIVAHSSRHYWRWLANEIEMPGVISRSITGHSLGKDHHDGTYASTPSLKKRYEWLKKIDPLRP